MIFFFVCDSLKCLVTSGTLVHVPVEVYYWDPGLKVQSKPINHTFGNRTQDRFRESTQKLTDALLDLRQREEDVKTLREELREASTASSDRFNSMQQELRQQSAMARKEAAEWKALAERLFWTAAHCCWTCRRNVFRCYKHVYM